MPKNETHDTHFLPDKRIVVVGDWLVDEHWVVGVHRSRTSSRVGKKHYRSIQTLGSTVTSFCGAGRTAAILHRARLKGDNDNFCEIVGLGVWHENDTSAMEAMLDSASVKGHTPHQIRLDYVGGEKACLLVNLASGNEPEQGPGTTRIIRIYQQTGSQVELVERIDWEVSTPPEGWFSLRDLNAHKKLQQALKLPIAAIVVKDIKKGAVSKELIKFLAHRFPDKPWFISSKEYIPSWMQFIKPEWIHLLEIPQAACKDAIDKTNKSRSGKSRLDSWMSAPSEPSKGALDLLDQLGEDYENAVIVAVPDDQTVLAHRKVGFSKTGEKEGVVWTSRGLDATPVGMPLASVCFAAFTAHLLHTPKEPLVKLVDMSMDFTEEWRSKEQGRVENPLNWDPKCEPSLDLSKGTTVHSKVLTWTDELERWRSAYRDVGVIKEGGGRGYIDLSCAMTEVKNYVCICATKRKVLRQVVKEMQAFKNEGGSAQHHDCGLSRFRKEPSGADACRRPGTLLPGIQYHPNDV